MRTSATFALLALALGLTASSLRAQGVPQLINYQGRVAVAGVNYTGQGQFKFALVNADGSQTYWSNDGTPAGQPASAVPLPVAGGLYSVLLGDAALPNMTAVPAAVFANADVRLRVWFNDGTNGSQLLAPDQRIAAVGYALMADGVKAGGVTSAMISAGAVGSAQLADGAVGSTQLGAGAAAANLNASGQSGVAAGGLILSATDNNAALQAAGYLRIGATTTPDAWLARAGVSPDPRVVFASVWTGAEMIIWGGGYASSYNTGARYNPASNSWTAMTLAGAPSPRSFPQGVWTGSEMIVWGGSTGNFFGYLGDGGRYRPAGDTWAAMSATNAPAARDLHTAVWTGTEMIVWGGTNTTNSFNTGGRYNPSTDAWTTLPTTGAPAARVSHAAVWTGSEMIVWGGFAEYNSNGNPQGTGARYSPVSNAWVALPTAGAPSARGSQVAVWTGSEMIVWGGRSSTATLGDGARYRPAGNLWASLASGGAPGPRTAATAVWTGSAMIVWGGRNVDGTAAYADGARYDPAGDAWTALSTAGAPAGRYIHSALWSGSEMLVWGGYPAGGAPLPNGGRYNPDADAWILIGDTGAHSPRYYHTAVWTGAEMIIWGGIDSGSNPLTDGGRFNPALNQWTPVTSAGQPNNRYAHSAVWTGTEMIVWGGFGYGQTITFLNTGGRYDPAADSWTATTTTNAPAVRAYHPAVWTGSEMIVFGGYNGTTALNTGSRYAPATDAWAATNPTGAPSARAYHPAVWTGSEMIIWGGSNGSSSNPLYLNTGARYRPATDAWTALPLNNAPAVRDHHTAVWTGTEMIVFGGYNGTSGLATGARYSPGSNVWIALPTAGAPGPRLQHTAVWTGTEMIVWSGGSGAAGVYLNDGGRFNLATGAWTALATAGAPAPRVQSSAVWSGTEMLIYGGTNGGAFNDVFSLTPGRTLYLYQRP